ncbi:MAG: transglutaminase domain-containing protein [Bacteroidota bacterium]
MRALAPVVLSLVLAVSASAQTCPSPLDGRDWTRVDAHALSASPRDATDLDRLAAYLSRAGRTEADRARAAFRWVAGHIAYDSASLVPGQRKQQSADSTLARRNGVCEGYARLLIALLGRMDIEARYISGWGLSTDDAAISPDGLHAWVAARLDGAWVLMDPTWAAGGVSGGRFFPRFRGEWFASPPDWFARRHIPTDERWQLLSRPLSLQDAVVRRIPEASCRTEPAAPTRRHSRSTRISSSDDGGPPWGDIGGVRYRVLSPATESPLRSRDRATVRVEAPDAAAVAVFDGSVMGPALRASGGVWSGTVRVGEHPLSIGLQVHRGGPWQMIRRIPVASR